VVSKKLLILCKTNTGNADLQKTTKKVWQFQKKLLILCKTKTENADLQKKFGGFKKITNFVQKTGMPKTVFRVGKDF